MSSDVDVEVISDEDDDDDCDIIKFNFDWFQKPPLSKEYNTTDVIEINDSDSETISASETSISHLTILNETSAPEANDADSTLNKETATIKEGSSVPVSFPDISRNKTLLSQCRPFTIKVVDCNKFPWYYKKYKLAQNMISPSPKSKLKIRPVDISTYIKSDVTANLHKNTSAVNNRKLQIDFKGNQGLIGLKINNCDKRNIDTALKASLKSKVNSNTTYDETNLSLVVASNATVERSTSKVIDIHLIRKNLEKSLNMKSSEPMNPTSDLTNKYGLKLAKNNTKTTNKAMTNKETPKETKESIEIDKICNLNPTKKLRKEETASNINNSENKTSRDSSIHKEDEKLKKNHDYKKTLSNKIKTSHKLILGTKPENKTELSNVKESDESYSKNFIKHFFSKKPLLDQHMNSFLNENKKSCDEKSVNSKNDSTIQNGTQKTPKRKQNQKRKSFDKLKKRKTKFDFENENSNNIIKSHEDNNNVRRQETTNLKTTTIEKHQKEYSKLPLDQNKKQSTNNTSLKNTQISSKNNYNINNKKIMHSKDTTENINENEKQQRAINANCKTPNTALFRSNKQINQEKDHKKILSNTMPFVQTTQNSFIKNNNAALVKSNYKISKIQGPGFSKSSIEVSKPCDTLVNNLNKNEKSLQCINVNAQPVEATVNSQIIEDSKISKTLQQNPITNNSNTSHSLINFLSAKFKEINAPNTINNISQNGGQPIGTHVTNRNTNGHRTITPSVIHNNGTFCAPNEMNIGQNTKQTGITFSYPNKSGNELNTTLPNNTVYGYVSRQNEYHSNFNKSIQPPRYPVMQAMLNNVPNDFCQNQTNQNNFHRAIPPFNYPVHPTPQFFQPQLQSSNISHCTQPMPIIVRNSEGNTLSVPPNPSSLTQFHPHIYHPPPPPYPPLPKVLQPPPPPPPPDTEPLPPLPSELHLPNNPSLPKLSLPSAPSITRNVQPSKFTITYIPKGIPQITAMKSVPLSIPLPTSNSLPTTSTTTACPPISNSSSLALSLPAPLSAPTTALHASSSSLEGTTIIGQNQDGFIRTIAIPKLATNPNTNNLSPKRSSSSKPPNTGYSPPILPIRTYEEYFMMLENEKLNRYNDVMKEDTRDSNGEELNNNNHINNIAGSNNENDKRKRKIPAQESSSVKSKKKIPLGVYKKRIINDCLNKGQGNDIKVNIEPKTESLLIKKSLDLDLGYNSDSNSKQL